MQTVKSTMDESLAVLGYAFVLPAQALHGQFIGLGGGHARPSGSFVFGDSAKECLVVIVSCLFGRD